MTNFFFNITAHGRYTQECLDVQFIFSHTRTRTSNEHAFCALQTHIRTRSFHCIHLNLFLLFPSVSLSLRSRQPLRDEFSAKYNTEHVYIYTNYILLNVIYSLSTVVYRKTFSVRVESYSKEEERGSERERDRERVRKRNRGRGREGVTDCRRMAIAASYYIIYLTIFEAFISLELS